MTRKAACEVAFAFARLRRRAGGMPRSAEASSTKDHTDDGARATRWDLSLRLGSDSSLRLGSSLRLQHTSHPDLTVTQLTAQMADADDCGA